MNKVNAKRKYPLGRHIVTDNETVGKCNIKVLRTDGRCSYYIPFRELRYLGDDNRRKIKLIQYRRKHFHMGGVAKVVFWKIC